MNSHLKNFRERTDVNIHDEKQVIERHALFEITRQLSSSLDSNEILNNILFTIMGRMLISKAAIFLLDENNLLYLAHSKGLREFHSISIAYEFSDKNVYSTSLFACPFHQQLSEYKLQFVIPIKANEKNIGVFSIGKKLNGIEFSEEELHFLESLCTIAGSFIENAVNYEKLNVANRKLDGKIQQLTTLLEIGKTLNQTIYFDEALKILSRVLMGQFMCLQHAVLYRVQNEHRCVFSRGVALNQEQIDFVFTHQVLKGYSVVSLKKQEIVGYILMGKKMDGSEMSAEENEFLFHIADRATAALENALLFKETLEKQKLEEEMMLARSIQQKLLPKTMPTLNNYQIHGSNQSSKKVGGDYFDFIHLSDGKLGVAIGDVSGKGAAAALLMSNLQASMHALTSNRSSDITEHISQANRIIYKNTSSDKYITFFYGELHPEAQMFQYVNAGHNYPLLYRNQTFIELQTGGLIIGMMEGMPYQSETIQLQSGDTLVCYTDGVTEAMNPEEEEYDVPRLKSVIESHAECNAETLHHKILEDVFAFSPNANDFDDITLIVLKVV